MDLGPNNSCVNNNIDMETNDDEESGWTTYLEDFSMKQRENNYSSSSDYDNNSFGSPSLLSDAASHAAWKQNSQSPFLKRLNLKKQKRNNKISDPDLEDTASSPVNSPKVHYQNFLLFFFYGSYSFSCFFLDLFRFVYQLGISRNIKIKEIITYGWLYILNK